MQSKLGKTGSCFCKLVNREPFSRTGGTLCPPFPVWWNFVVQNINILYSHCIAGTHNRGYIVRIKYIFQNDRKIGLSSI